ncbi:MAG: hypothetical protein ACI3U0_00535 [Oscillospiraceae bacterium]
MKKTIKNLALVLLIAALMLTVTGCSASDYKTATQLMKSGDAAAASEMFKALGDYKDSAALAVACDYTVAKNTYDAGEYEKAAELFTALGDYEDSAALASQAADKAIAQKLVGEWFSAEDDVTDLILDEIIYSVSGDADAEELFANMDFGNLTLRYRISFTEKGTFSLETDEEAASALVNKILNSFSDGVYAYMIDVFTQAAEENGTTLESLMSDYGCDNFDDFFVVAAGESFTDFIASFLSEDDLMAMSAQSAVNGVFTVENGTVELSYGKGGASYIEYDAETDTFLLTGGDLATTNLAFSRT